MRKQIIMGLGLALTITGTAAAQQQDANRGRDRAGEQRGPGMRGSGGPDALLLKGIELTEGQRAQIAQLGKTQREAMQARRGQDDTQREQVRAARERGDTAAVRAIVTKNRQAGQQERAQHLAAIRNILTAEQRVQFDRNVAELQARGDEREQRVRARDQRPDREGQAQRPLRGKGARGGR